MAIPEKYKHIDFTPPAGVRKEAEYGLKLRREHGRGGTAVGIARARDLANGVKLSPSTVRRMKAFFDRHASDSKAEGFRRGEKGWPSNGVIANKLWGGPSGYSWAKKVVAQMEAADARSYSTDTETRSIEVKETPMHNVERRYLAASGTENATEGSLNVEHRADPETGERRTYLVGYAAKFGTDSLMLGDFIERIAPTAFEIVENGKDLEGNPLETRGLFNHDPNHLIGRYPTTMKLKVDKIGLKYEIMLPETRKDIEEMVSRGDLKGSSFSFVVAEGGEKWTREGGKSRRLVTKIKSLLDCGPVTYPAYKDSSVAVARRSYEQFVSTPKVDLAAEMRKHQEFLDERRGFCPTGPGGGIDNSCGSKGGGGEKPGDDVGADIHAELPTAPAMVSGFAGAAVGAVAGLPGAVIGGIVGAATGLAYGAKKGNEYVVKVEKALKKAGLSVKKLDAFARQIGKSLSITADKSDIVEASGGDVKVSVYNFKKGEAGALSGRVAMVEGATSAIGGEGTESVSRLAQTLAKAGKELGVDHIAVTLDMMDRLHEEEFVDAGFTHSITGDDATRITMIKSYKRSSKRYDELMAFYAERRGFCPTGEGGGVDNSCGGAGQIAGYKVEPKMGFDSGKYKEWKKGDHLDKSKENDAQAFIDKAREEQLSKGGKDKGKADEGGGVQTWSKGEHFPWTVKQVGDGDGHLQGIHPDGSKTEKYPFKGGDTSEAYKKLSDEINSKPKKRSIDPRQVIEDTLRFLKDRR